QPSRSLRPEPTSKPVGLHLKTRLRLSHKRGPLQGATMLTIYGFGGTAAKTTLGVGILFAALLYLSPRNIARLTAILSVLIIITAPLTFSRLARIEGITEAAERAKFSAWHRLMIWS